MHKIKFPKRRADGSFCVEIVMTLSRANTDSIESAIQNWWSNEWAPKNKKWVQVWNKGHKRERTEVRLYDDEFSDAPQLLRCDESQLRFRLLGKSYEKKLWKDWLISRIIPDLKAQFPSIGEFVSIQNCD